jgi:tetratricopeptide (TPR) repeat protein
MPSHIFTRKGLWQESIDWNTRASNAALRLSAKGPITHHTFHAFDYMAYALLQQGQDEKARLIAQRIDSFDLPFDNSPATAYAIAALEARIPLENHDWKGAAAVPLPDTSVVSWNKYPQYEALRYFARGIGGARSGNMDVAKSAYTKLESIYNGFNDAPENKYWKDQVNIQRIAVQAWIAYAENDKANALKLMQESANLEEATQKNPVSPGELLPASELLADMYMEINQPAKALDEYKRSLASRPNRFNSLYGAGKAAEALHDQETAKNYYAQLIAVQGATPSKREASLYAQNYIRGI